MGYLDTRKLQRRIMFFAAFAVLLTGLATAILGVLPLSETLRNQATDSVTSTLELQTYALSEHAENLRGMATQINSRTAIRQALELYTRNEMSFDDLVAYTTPRLADALDKGKHMTGITRVDATGRIIAAIGEPIPQNQISPPTEEVKVVGPVSSSSGAKIFITTPIFSGNDNSLLGADTVSFDGALIAPSLWPGSKTIASTMSFVNSGEDGQWYSAFEGELVHATPPVTIPLPSKTPIEVSSKTGQWVVSGQPIQNTPWQILVCVPEHDVFSTVRSALFRSIIITAAMAMTGIIALLLVLRPLVRSTLATQQAMEDEIAAQQVMRANLEEERQRLDASNQDLEQFAYAASHDLQQPLRMITGFLELLRRRSKDHLSNEELEFIGFAVDGAKRLHDMINGLLEYSRVGRLEDAMRDIDINQTVELALLNLAPRMDEAGAHACIGLLPTLHAEPNQMLRLFQNLIDNAVKYRHPDRPPRITIDATTKDGTWIIHVSDNGKGLDPASAENAFRLFQRMNPDDKIDGTGLGLAMCQKIVLRHGGTIQLNADRPEGLEVIITLPRTQTHRPITLKPQIKQSDTQPAEKRLDYARL